MVASMTKRVNHRTLIGLPDKRIVARHTAVVAQPQHLAAQGVGILRSVWILWAGGRREIQHAVAAERDPRRARRAGREDVAHFPQRVAIPPAARDPDGPLFFVDRLCVRELDEPTFGK